MKSGECICTEPHRDIDGLELSHEEDEIVSQIVRDWEGSMTAGSVKPDLESFGEKLEGMDTNRLVEDWDDYTKNIASMREMLAMIEMEITKRMRADSATAVAHDDFTVELAGTPKYDESKLYAVLEYIPQADLVKAGAYTPAHEETVQVPEKFNATKLKPFGKFGSDIRDIIQGARWESNVRLRIKPKAKTEVQA